MMHHEDYRGFGHLLRQAANLKIDQISVRKGDFTLSIQSGGKGDILDISEKMDVVDDLDTNKDAEEVAKIDSIPVKEKKKEADTKKVTEEVKESAKNKSTYSHTLKAPLVGTFYSSDGPGKPPLVKIGDSIKKGDKVCFIEAMKLFNEIKAAEDCKILAFLAKDGEGVKKEQSLVAYEPA